MRLTGWLRPMRLLQVAVCLSASVAPAAAWAQTEVRKTLPERAGAQTEVKKTQTEVKKTMPGQALQSGEAPVTPTWSAEIETRGVSASDVQVTGDRQRTRFSLHLSSGIAYQIFTLAEPYRLIIDMPDVNFGQLKGAGQREQGLVQAFRYGLFAAGKSRIVIDTTGPVRIESATIARRSGTRAVVLNIDLVPTDAASFVRNPPTAPRATSPDATEAANKAKPGAKPIVVIDAGHGGVDPGAVRGEVIEKDVVLSVARHLRTVLAGKGRYDVQMTRATDVFVALDRRLQISREKGAALFISIHADTVAEEERAQIVRGATVYTLSEQASDDEAKELATKENFSDAIAGVALPSDSDEVVANILIDLAQRETQNRSTVFARSIVGELAGGLHTRKLRSAGFRVLKAPDVPSVLLEIGFLSNPDDEKHLVSDVWRERMGASIVEAIDGYFAKRIARAPF